MTDLRQAAQAALEALTIYSDAQCSLKGRNAITALRTALEQQAEPVPRWDVDEDNPDSLAKHPAFRATQEQQAEPVAWTTMPEAADWCFVSGSKDPTSKLEGKWFPLYTTPPQRQWVSLTDEDVNRESAMIASQMKLAFHAGMYVAQKILKERNHD